MSRIARGLTLVLIPVLIATGCARSPEAKKARYLERGDRYVAREKYREAILEYRNVLRIDQNNARAIRQLGLAHYQLGDAAQAYAFLLKSQELDPNDLEVRLKLGAIYVLGRKPDEARQEANFVLGKEPRNLEALALLAGSATSPEEVADAIQRLEAAQADFGNQAKPRIALATLYLRKQDPAAAERVLQEAVAKDPKSVEAHTALASFYLSRQDTVKAEQEFKMAADLAPAGSPARLKLAEFYLLAGRREEAKKTLQGIAKKAPDYLPAWRRLAEIAFAEQNYEESLKALQPVLKKNPQDLEGIFLRARVHLAKRETTDAVQGFQQVLKLEPRFTPARFQLALAQLQAGNVQQAKAELKEATRLVPNFTEAILLLAELNIQTGAAQAAIEDLEKFIASRPPRVIQAYGLLGSAYLAKGEPAKATEAYRNVLQLAPKDPRGHYLVALGLRAQGKSGEAKSELEAALTLSPGYVEAAAQLVQIALGDKRPDQALDRVKKQVALVPSSAGLQDLLGTVYMARGERDLAETAFLKATELEPRLVDPYLQLGRLYAASGRYDQAVARLNQAVKLNPQNIAPLMLLGVTYQQKGDIPKAEQAFEQVLAVNPRSPVAANNLAWLLSEHGGDKEKALQLAQTAKEALPDDPHVSDTLGWILYKREIYQRAVGLLKESASKLPDDAAVQYHLGMASEKVGDIEGARQALSRAAASPLNLPEKVEAQKALAALK